MWVDAAGFGRLVHDQEQLGMRGLRSLFSQLIAFADERKNHRTLKFGRDLAQDVHAFGLKLAQM